MDYFCKMNKSFKQQALPRRVTNGLGYEFLTGRLEIGKITPKLILIQQSTIKCT